MMSVMRGIKRVYKVVDTCAENSKKTPYFYSSFGLENESEVTDKPKVIILGSGPNRIGQGIYLIIVAFMVCRLCKKQAMKPSWSTAILKLCPPILIWLISCISNQFTGASTEIIDLEKPHGIIVQLVVKRR